jgi:hypothetical protein
MFMTKKGIFFGIASLVFAGATALTVGASAYRGDASVKGSNYSPERHEVMQKAFESGDYEAWKNSMNGRGRVTEMVNAENFHRFVEMRKLMQEGKTDEANEIRKELGLGQKNGQGQFKGHRGQGRGGNFTDVNGNGICDLME